MSKTEWKKLEDFCTVQAGGTPSRHQTEYWKNGNIPWVKISDINGKYTSSTTEFITNEGLSNSSAKLFHPNTILYTIEFKLICIDVLKINEL